MESLWLGVESEGRSREPTRSLSKRWWCVGRRGGAGAGRSGWILGLVGFPERLVVGLEERGERGGEDECQALLGLEVGVWGGADWASVECRCGCSGPHSSV